MKRVMYPLLVSLLMISVTTWGANDKTIANLKTAFNGESTASAKYAAYAAKAKIEGYPQIAVLFTAASKAEGIHANNHKAVLQKLGVAVEPVKPVFSAKTTAENLTDAITGETEEFSKMYPGFISTAKEENVMDAVKSFSWAMDTEKKHGDFYKTALAALNSKKQDTLPKTYSVCPKCGNTFNEAKPAAKCPFCYTAEAKYIKVF